MSELAIQVENLSKRYRIGAAQARHDTLRDAFTGLLRRRSARAPRPVETRAGEEEIFWALRDVSFEVKAGEVVGVIGQNGAGKSTLLKILARITEPSAGRAEIYGRVGSLLEVGTGFHPELTGRENIYLNGAILGMRRAEIAAKFDEIVAFAEIEQFLDTPVKRYSSGMYVRLAFAVAAHLEPEILLVDEVLAVGDAAFQKKCLGKMGDVAREGRTVFFVSHNMAAVQALCHKAILFKSGSLTNYDSAPEVVRDYYRAFRASELVPLGERQDRAGDGSAKLVAFELKSTEPDDVIRSSSGLRVSLRYQCDGPIRGARFLVGIYDAADVGVFLLDSDATSALPETLDAEGTITCTTDPIHLTPGRCYVNLALLRGGDMADYIQYAAYFDVEADNTHGSSKIPSRDWVLYVLKHHWSLAGN